MPRDNGNEVYNAVAFTITLNNLFANLKKKLTSGSLQEDMD
jgi:hypothetical protein